MSSCFIFNCFFRFSKRSSWLFLLSSIPGNCRTSSLAASKRFCSSTIFWLHSCDSLYSKYNAIHNYNATFVKCQNYIISRYKLPNLERLFLFVKLTCFCHLCYIFQTSWWFRKLCSSPAKIPLQRFPFYCIITDSLVIISI